MAADCLPGEALNSVHAHCIGLPLSETLSASRESILLDVGRESSCVVENTICRRVNDFIRSLPAAIMTPRVYHIEGSLNDL